MAIGQEFASDAKYEYAAFGEQVAADAFDKALQEKVWNAVQAAEQRNERAADVSEPV